MSSQLKLVFLGTGTSTGLPVIGCQCPVCQSQDPKDKRFRTSAYLTYPRGTKILIDAGPDLRQQFLAQGLNWLDGLLITHGHYDHVGGIDELRQVNFIMRRDIEVYGDSTALREITIRFDYIFKKNIQEGGGIPHLHLNTVKPGEVFRVGEADILPLEVMHGEIPILGYRFGSLVYITDASFIPESTFHMLTGADNPVEVLVINALRHRPHSTHFNIEQSLEVIRRINPRRAYLVHVTHDVGHASTQASLPENVFLAYDGLTVEIS